MNETVLISLARVENRVVKLLYVHFLLVGELRGEPIYDCFFALGSVDVLVFLVLDDADFAAELHTLAVKVGNLIVDTVDLLSCLG